MYNIQVLLVFNIKVTYQIIFFYTHCQNKIIENNALNKQTFRNTRKS